MALPPNHFEKPVGQFLSRTTTETAVLVPLSLPAQTRGESERNQKALIESPQQQS